MTAPPLRRRRLLLAAAGLAVARTGAATEAPATLEIGELTAPQLRTAVAAGWRTVILPSGGLEQNGPHMIIAKHDHIMRWTARRIAEALGHTLVAPVISYVPQGGWDPPSGNMAWAGTIGVTPQVFAGILEGAARSLKLSGFTAICMLADNGASQRPQDEVATRLDAAWMRQGVRVLSVGAYYRAAPAQDVWLRGQGHPEAALGAHAGLADTSELMAVHPNGVDLGRLEGHSGAALERLGASGDPSRASAGIGQAILPIRVDAAVAEIRARLGPR